MLAVEMMESLLHPELGSAKKNLSLGDDNFSKLMNKQGGLPRATWE